MKCKRGDKIEDKKLTQEQIDSLIESLNAGCVIENSNLTDFFVCKHCRRIYNISFYFTEQLLANRYLYFKKADTFPRSLLLNNMNPNIPAHSCNLVLFSDLLKNTISCNKTNLTPEDLQKLEDFVKQLKPIDITYNKYGAKATRYQAILEDMKLKWETKEKEGINNYKRSILRK